MTGTKLAESAKIVPVTKIVDSPKIVPVTENSKYPLERITFVPHNDRRHGVKEFNTEITEFTGEDFRRDAPFKLLGGLRVL